MYQSEKSFVHSVQSGKKLENSQVVSLNLHKMAIILCEVWLISRTFKCKYYQIFKCKYRPQAHSKFKQLLSFIEVLSF